MGTEINNEEMLRRQVEFMREFFQMVLVTINSKTSKSKRDILIEECCNQIKNGDTAYGLSLPKKDADILTKKLEEKGIPFVPIDLPGDKTAIYVSQENSKVLADLKHMQDFSDINHYKDIDPNDMLLSLKSIYDETPVIKYSLSENLDAEICKQKLYNSGITFSSYQDENGNINIAINPNEMYNPGVDRDFLTFEAAMAYEESKKALNPDWYNIRAKQAEWDRDQFREFAVRVANGENVRFGNYKGGSDPYFETKNDMIYINTFENGKRVSTPIENSEGVKDVNAIINLCSSRADNIYNNICIKEENFMDHDLLNSGRGDAENIKSILDGRKERPTVIEKGMFDLDSSGKDIQEFVKSLCRDAGNQTKTNLSSYDYKSVAKAVTNERECLINMLKDMENNPKVKAFLDDAEKAPNLDKKKFFEAMISNLSGGRKYSRGVPIADQIATISKARQLATKGSEKVTEKETNPEKE